MNLIYNFDKLIGITNITKYDSREIESINVSEENKIIINNKEFIPRYSSFDTRRKELPSIRLYKSGSIKSIDLEEQTEVNIGNYSFKAEKVIFYEDGNIKKIFPLNGKISAYWSEDDEYELAPKYKMDFEFTKIYNKLISVKFYESGNIKSITLWPSEKINIKYNDKILRCKTGFSLYENGRLMTCEPLSPFLINTKIGCLEAYDKNNIGIHGENNSLKFDEKGNVKELITSTNIIKVIDKEGRITVHSPKKELLFVNSEEEDIITVNVKFKDNNVIIDDSYIYDLDSYQFIIEQYGERILII